MFTKLVSLLVLAIWSGGMLTDVADFFHYGQPSAAHTASAPASGPLLTSWNALMGVLTNH